MEELIPYFFGFLGVLATALGGYFIAKRSKSGRIGTTEAATLWAERTQMANEMRDELVRLRAVIESSATASTAAVIAAALAAQTAATEITNLRKEVADLKADLAELLTQIKDQGGTPK